MERRRRNLRMLHAAIAHGDTIRETEIEIEIKIERERERERTLYRKLRSIIPELFVN
jgi:hypothetical protein